jgi:hypothetical protein
MPVICPTAQVFFSSAPRVQNSLVHGDPASMSRKREPAKNVVGDVIEEDEPQCRPATSVEPQVTAVCVEMIGSKGWRPPTNDRSRFISLHSSRIYFAPEPC